jgi:hypothetical protein
MSHNAQAMSNRKSASRKLADRILLRFIECVFLTVLVVCIIGQSYMLFFASDEVYRALSLTLGFELVR